MQVNKQGACGVAARSVVWRSDHTGQLPEQQGWPVPSHAAAAAQASKWVGQAAAYALDLHCGGGGAREG